MRQHGFWALTYWAIGILYWLSAASLIVYAIALKTSLPWIGTKSEAIAAVVLWLQSTAPLGIMVCTGVSAAGKVARSIIGPPWIWDSVHEVLDQLRLLAFDKCKTTDPVHHHRVTLFKAVVDPWFPFRIRRYLRWLVPVERSGHTTRNSSVAFRIPDNADEAEGIAGQTWAINKVLVVKGLPDIANLKKGQAALVKDYAERTFVTVDWIRKENPVGRSFCGIPVEVKGKLWGVLVFDSRDENSIDDQEASRVYQQYGKFLGNLLARASQ
jgi:hypothetical protein